MLDHSYKPLIKLTNNWRAQRLEEIPEILIAEAP